MFRSSIKADLLEKTFQETVTQDLESLSVEKLIADYERTQEPVRQEAVARESRIRRAITEVRKKIAKIVDAIADGVDLPAVRDKLKTLTREEGELAEEAVRCQVHADRDIRFSTDMLRIYFQRATDVLAEATPEELREVYKDLFKFEVDLEKKRARLFVRTAPASEAREIAIRDPRTRAGRSARI